MKTRLKLIIAASALILLGVAVTQWPVVRAQDAPVPVIVQQGIAQYKVIDIGQIAVARGGTTAGALEALLNQAADQGWRVVAGSGSWVILSR